MDGTASLEGEAEEAAVEEAEAEEEEGEDDASVLVLVTVEGSIEAADATV